MKPDTFTGFRNFDKECINYLSDTDDAGKIQSNPESVHQIQYNTAVLCTCRETIQHCWTKIGVPRRNHLSDSMFEKRLLLKANRSQLEVMVTVQINVFSFYVGTTRRYFLLLC